MIKAFCKGVFVMIRSVKSSACRKILAAIMAAAAIMLSIVAVYATFVKEANADPLEKVSAHPVYDSRSGKYGYKYYGEDSWARYPSYKEAGYPDNNGRARVVYPSGLESYVYVSPKYSYKRSNYQYTSQSHNKRKKVSAYPVYDSKSGKYGYKYYGEDTWARYPSYKEAYYPDENGRAKVVYPSGLESYVYVSPKYSYTF